MSFVERSWIEPNILMSESVCVSNFVYLGYTLGSAGSMEEASKESGMFLG